MIRSLISGVKMCSSSPKMTQRLLLLPMQRQHLHGSSPTPLGVNPLQINNKAIDMEFSDYNTIIKSALLDVPDPVRCRKALDWFERCYDYLVPHGKLNRGRTIVETFKFLVPNPTPEEMVRANAVGWAIEVVQTCTLLADDIEDGSTMRRGRPAWHTLPDVGVALAFNDAQTLHVAAYRLLDIFCKGHPSHLNLCVLLTSAGAQLTMGQTMDLLSTRDDIRDSTMQAVETIAR